MIIDYARRTAIVLGLFFNHFSGILYRRDRRTGEMIEMNDENVEMADYEEWLIGEGE